MHQLIDPFGRKIEYLRLSVTDRCNFRCFYCIPKGHDAFTDTKDRLHSDDLLRLVRIFSELGVHKIRITGGEPLVRNDLIDLVGQIKTLPGVGELSLSTNASQLAKFAPQLKPAGIDRINVSLDSLKPEVFYKITQSQLSPVIEGLMAAKSAGMHPIKINMVVMRDLNLSEVCDMVNFCRTHQFTLRFIETMPIGKAGQSANKRYVSLSEVREILRREFELEPAKMTGAGPAEYLKLKNGRLKIGFITPMSQHFCESCNRIRLSSDGALHLCLGQQDRLELAPLLKQEADDNELKKAIIEAIRRKPKQHDFHGCHNPNGRAMSITGG